MTLRGQRRSDAVQRVKTMNMTKAEYLTALTFPRED